MPGDPFWLPGTAAVCSSTLVAIVGGLLVSRIVAADQDATAAQREIDTLAADLANATKSLGRAEEELRAAEARQWVAQVLPLMAAAISVTHRDPDIEHLMDRAPVGRPKDELKPEYERVCGLLGAAFANIETELQQRNQELLPATWQHARDGLRLAKDDDFDDRVVHEAYAQVYLQKSKAATQSGQPWPEPGLPTPPDPVPIALSGFPPLSQLKGERNRLEPLVANLQARLETVRKARTAPTARELRPTYRALGAAALVGILFPLAVLAWDPESIALWLRCLLAASVAATVVLVYVALRNRPGGLGRTGP